MRDSGFKIACIVFGILIAGALICRLSNEQTDRHKVISVDKVEAVSGDSDGFYTDVYYLVTTDKGAYKVVMSGLNAAPQYAGLQKDSSYTMKTRGLRIPILGVYPNIIKVY